MLVILVRAVRLRQTHRLIRRGTEYRDLLCKRPPPATPVPEIEMVEYEKNSLNAELSGWKNPGCFSKYRVSEQALPIEFRNRVQPHGVAEIPGGSVADIPGGSVAEIPGGSVAEIPGGTGVSPVQ